MADRTPDFVRTLYFDIQTIDGVRSLEIWNGVREFEDPFERTGLIKNLYKVVAPLVNEAFFPKPFELHSRAVKEAVSRMLSGPCGGSPAGIFERFPDPPVGDADSKAFYYLIKAEAKALVEDAASGMNEAGSREGFPDGLFDFREMRIVDNELPYIIFTEKEYRVIHGLAIAYLWIIDVQSMFLSTLEENGIPAQILAAYRRFDKKVLKENPLVVKGEKLDPREFAVRLRGRLPYEDYLDVFENVFFWFETSRTRFGPKD
jgi:hypothetical protein